MAVYINKKDKIHMAELLREYWLISDDPTFETSQTLQLKKQRLMSALFKYLDKIILGVINSPQYAYYRFGEVDDIINEMAPIREEFCKYL